MKCTAWITALVLLSSSLSGARSHAQTSELAWEACPFLLTQASKVIMLRLKAKFNHEDAEGVFELACRAARLYDESRHKSAVTRKVPQEDAADIFCKNSTSLEYCRNHNRAKSPNVPPSAFQEALRRSGQNSRTQGWALKCRQNNLTAEGCATAILREAERK